MNLQTRYSLARRYREETSAAVAALARRSKKIIRHPLTVKKFIKDFPLVNTYITSKFSGVDISEIPIYIASNVAMDKNGFGDCGGCYISAPEKLILLKKNIRMGGGSKSQPRFDRVLQNKIKCKVITEDVLVHEMIHAVSDASNMSGRQFTFSEEEFVYTNSVDFYVQKGMSDEQIVVGNFLPFCTKDVIQTQLRDVLFSVDPDLDFSDYPLMLKYCDKNANRVTDIILDRAKDMGRQMIALYRKYGALVAPSSVDVTEATQIENRFSGLDMDL